MQDACNDVVRLDILMGDTYGNIRLLHSKSVLKNRLIVTPYLDAPQIHYFQPFWSLVVLTWTKLISP